MTWETDLSNPNKIPELFGTAEEKWGAVDIVVNNAAFDTPDTFLPQTLYQSFLCARIADTTERV